MNELLQQLDKRRRMVQMTQTHLAFQSGLTQAAVSNILAGKTSPTLATLKALVTAMGGKVTVEFPTEPYQFRNQRAEWLDRSPSSGMVWTIHKDWQSLPPLPRRPAPKPTGKPDNS
ncbi:helix-turn-helix protein [Caulifigura coniformis]|uniref:Helix-turn-helix protein n=1 Tax=Caulifigura coniformis TaxID=2527983 RepID=A0A517SHA4_9PLAN|nr:helix-turn-helix transcriptional regulator [Caulifigura coniformis]QDT55503.1 helix-turn-helix protein [Caulifigura coniformis]